MPFSLGEGRSRGRDGEEGGILPKRISSVSKSVFSAGYLQREKGGKKKARVGLALYLPLACPPLAPRAILTHLPLLAWGGARRQAGARRAQRCSAPGSEPSGPPPPVSVDARRGGSASRARAAASGGRSAGVPQARPQPGPGLAPSGMGPPGTPVPAAAAGPGLPAPPLGGWLRPGRGPRPGGQGGGPGTASGQAGGPPVRTGSLGPGRRAPLPAPRGPGTGPRGLGRARTAFRAAD